MPPESKRDIVHLNLKPSADWAGPFWIASSTFLILATVLSESDPIQLLKSEFLVIVGGSILGCFFLTILTAMWVAFRGLNRKFHTSIFLRAAMVGMLVPGVLLVTYFLLDYINYGAPTKASPGLEVNLLTAILAGEALVRYASYPFTEFLNEDS